jgi:hypothetical protein
MNWAHFPGMNEIKRLLAFLGLCLGGMDNWRECLRAIASRAEVHRMYVGSFGSNPDAAYLRNKLLLRLGRARTILIVEGPDIADVLLKCAAVMRLVGECNSDLSQKRKRGPTE